MNNPEIIFEDNHLLVVNKPVNLLTQEDNSGDADLLNALKDFIKIRDNKQGNVYLGMVHRLDRVVSGLIVFAKTSKAASRLSEQIRERKFIKHYIAHVLTSPSKSSDRLVNYIKKDSRTKTAVISNKEKDGFKKAILSYTILGEKPNGCFLEINLETGRSHQIRAQLAHIGHPIVGDSKYGFRYNNAIKHKIRGIHLFSSHIEFEHPTLKKTIQFSLLPDWFKP